MARPRKHPHEKRTASIRADLTLAEKEHIREQSAAAGLTEAEYVRRRVLGFVVSPPPRKTDANLVSELNRIGVNVNQIARSINAGRRFNVDPDTVLAELRGILGKVAKAYGS